jgi:hypothetical protein
MLSTGAPVILNSGLATLPAAHTTVSVGIFQPTAFTDPGSTEVTSDSVRTSTPSRSSDSRAFRLSDSG